MATAASYDEWDDPGIGFSTEQIANHSPTLFAAGRVNELCHRGQMALRHSDIPGLSKPDWWKKVSAKCFDLASWYAVAGQAPGIDREALRVLPDAGSEDGKALTVEAQSVSDENTWLNEWSAEVEGEMRIYVSLGRRCASAKDTSKWGKREKSLSNKVANAISNEISGIGKLSALLTSTSK